MYPKQLEYEKRSVYYRESDCFTQSPQHLVHAYLHKNYTHKMHIHQFCEMNIIVSGEGRHYIGNSSLHAGVGDVFIIPPDVPHGYFSNGTLDILHILLRADFLQRYREDLYQLPAFAMLFDIEPQVRYSSGRPYNLQIQSHILPSFRAECDRIIKAEETAQYTYQNILTLGFIGNLGELLRQGMQKKEFCTNGSELLYVMEYIMENLEEKLTLDVLAAKANMSKATLNRHFKDILHTSPMRFVMDCRLQKARALLSQSDLSKTEIAHLCGFFDIAHLNKYL